MNKLEDTLNSSVEFGSIGHVDEGEAATMTPEETATALRLVEEILTKKVPGVVFIAQHRKEQDTVGGMFYGWEIPKKMVIKIFLHSSGLSIEDLTN